MSDLVTLDNDRQLTSIANRAREYAHQAKAHNTVRAYRFDWADFERWTAHHGLASLPALPETVALYLADLAEVGRKTSTIQRRLSAISQAHQLAGYDSPTRDVRVRKVWAGIRRLHGTGQVGKAPITTTELRRMVATLPVSIKGGRDRLALLMGFAGAFRRSELVALNVADIEPTGDGLIVTLHRSKTDQDGEGRKIGIPYGSNPLTCPVRAHQSWLTTAEIVDGPLLRSIDRHGNIGEGRLSDKAIALIVKQAAEAAGLDPTRYAGHSLRAGLATAAALAGVSERAIMTQTGHKSLIVLRRYIRDGSLFRENAASRVGL